MHAIIPRSRVLFVAVFLLLWGAPRLLFASPPEPSDDRLTPVDDRELIVDSQLEIPSEPSLPFWLELSGGVRLAENRTDVVIGAGVGARFDALLRPSRRTLALAVDAEDAPELREPMVLDGALVRGAVRAAIRAAATPNEADLDALGTRARLSALLPELRLRLARIVDEDETLSPTEYDPTRIVASGKTSLWLEGRATFRLDRLVFADEEIDLEKLRFERVKFERAMVREVSNQLERWHRCERLLLEEDLPVARIAELEADRLAAEASLEVLTNGWFSEAVRKRSSPPKATPTRARSDEVGREPQPPMSFTRDAVLVGDLHRDVDLTPEK